MVRTNRSIKLPWYDDKERIIGVFGCSIAFGEHNLASSLIQLINAGLLSIPTSGLNSLLNRKIGDEYLSIREMTCLKHVIKGQTAKMIAKSLNISKITVETHLENFKK